MYPSNYKAHKAKKIKKYIKRKIKTTCCKKSFNVFLFEFETSRDNATKNKIYPAMLFNLPKKGKKKNPILSEF